MSQQINLFSPVFLRQEKYFSAMAMVQALAMICFGLAAFYGYARYQSSALERLAQNVAQQLKQERDQLTAVVARTVNTTSALLASETSRLEKQRDGQREILTTLRTTDFGAAGGFTPFFEAFARRTVSGLWLTGFTVGSGGNELVVQGRATRAEVLPAYLDGLNEEAVMRGRKVVELRLNAKEEKPKENARGNAPVRFVDFTMVAPRSVGAPNPSGPSAKAGSIGAKP